MSDFISRQAAIDAVMNTEPVFDGGGKTYQATADVISALTGLPSAHPLDPCETCLHKSNGWDEEPCDGCTGTESKYKPDNGWIPVSERLPEPCMAVLGYAPKYQNIYALYYDSVCGWMIWNPIRDDCLPESQGEITAWMPLPDPYKEEER